MNLLTIDVGTVASIATQVWNVTNSIISCEALTSHANLISTADARRSDYWYRLSVSDVWCQCLHRIGLCAPQCTNLVLGRKDELSYVSTAFDVGSHLLTHLTGCDRAWARATDARVGAIKEFLLGYKVIKVCECATSTPLPTDAVCQLNAFEPYFRGRIDHLRSTEVV
jgi:hypothetical protein